MVFTVHIMLRTLVILTTATIGLTHIPTGGALRDSIICTIFMHIMWIRMVILVIMLSLIIQSRIPAGKIVISNSKIS